MPIFIPSGFFGPSRCLIPTPGLTSEYPICAVCVCVCVYTHLHPHTLPPALKIEVRGVARILDVGCAHPGFAPYPARIRCPIVRCAHPSK